jgi:hypothetical protein
MSDTNKLPDEGLVQKFLDLLRTFLTIDSKPVDDEDWQDFSIAARPEMEKYAAVASEHYKQQWVKVATDTSYPETTFIGCEKGSEWVGEVDYYKGKIYRVTDTYGADPITLSHYQPLPEPPQS